MSIVYRHLAGRSSCIQLLVNKNHRTTQISIFHFSNNLLLADSSKKSIHIHFMFFFFFSMFSHFFTIARDLAKLRPWLMTWWTGPSDGAKALASQIGWGPHGTWLLPRYELWCPKKWSKNIKTAKTSHVEYSELFMSFLDLFKVIFYFSIEETIFWDDDFILFAGVSSKSTHFVGFSFLTSLWLQHLHGQILRPCFVSRMWRNWAVRLLGPGLACCFFNIY